MSKSPTQKQNEGAMRNAVWNAMTPAEQIAELKTRRGESKKQIARLEKKLSRV